METTIITAIISAVVTLIVCLINNYFTGKRAIKSALDEKEKDQRSREEGFVKAIDNQHQEIVVLSMKLDTLSENVQKHNNVLERVYKLETHAVQYGEVMNRLEQRIEDWHNDTLRRLEALEAK